MTIAPSLKSFLDLIAWSEGTSTSPITKNDGYDVIVTGINGPSIFTDYSDHPFAPQFKRPPVQWHLNPPEYSTAAGRYQVLYHWWFAYRTELKLSDFSAASQDAYVLEILREHEALSLIVEGNIQGAIIACHGEWESFPDGVSQGKGPHTMGTLLEQYQAFLNG